MGGVFEFENRVNYLYNSTMSAYGIPPSSVVLDSPYRIINLFIYM